MADTIEIIQGTATTVEVAGPTGPQGIAGATGATGATGAQGPAGTGIETLTTAGDLLTRNSTQAIRLGIGTIGQVLKVSSQGLPHWAAEEAAGGNPFDQDLNTTDDVQFNTVGIGDTPTGSARKFHQHGGKFTVESSSGSYGQFQVINPSAGEVSFVLANEAVANEDGTITSQTAAQVWAFGTGSYGNSETTFVIGNNEGSSVFHVLPDGKVGLGSGHSDPAEALDVAGNIVAGNIALRDLDNDFAATFDAQDNLTANRTYDLPDASGTLALQGAITTSGLTQATARILGRTTASTGAVEEIQIGEGLSLSAGQLSATGGGGGDTVSIETTAADILSVSSGAISADDAGADRIVYWNNTSNKLTYGTPSDVGAAASSHTHSDATQSVAGFLSTADKTKLDGIASGAEVNVNADWNASSGDAQILNKPTLGTAAAAATTDFAAASHTHAASAITSGTLDVARLPVGTGSTQVAAGNHTHVVADVAGAAASGSITTSGLTQSTARILGRTSSSTGAVEEITVGSGLSLSAGELSSTVSAGIPATLLDAKGDLIVASAADTVARLPVGGTNGHVLTVDSAETLGVKWAAAAGGVGGGTGSTDNSILRSDGTGGSTLQDSALVIDDATTSTQANVALANNHSETNSSLVLRPKGNGAFILLKPDGTPANGNARGQFAVDLQLETNAAARVASGNYSFAVGRRCTASGLHSVAIGEQCLAGSASYTISLGRAATASANGAICLSGDTCTASGQETFVAGGNQNTASASSSMTLGGDYAVSDRGGMVAQANGRFAANGDAQWIHIVLRAKTTTNAAVELLINSARVTNGRLTCPSGKIISGIINIHGVKSDGTASAHYVRQFQVKNVAGTSSYPYTAATIGTDFASSTSITFNDPDANGDALSISVTGITSEIWRWTAHVSAVETAYGT
jgi:hypothetical protein